MTMRYAHLAPEGARDAVCLLVARPWQNSRDLTEPIEIIVEAAGVEPASENASDRTSTRVGTPFEVSRPPAAAGLRAQQAN